MTYPHEDMSLDDLIERMRRIGAVWLSNRDLLLLEELIRRVKHTTKEKQNG